MARTPLFSELVRLLRLARAARRAGVDVVLFRDMQAEKAALSRRRFLEYSAALAVAPAFMRCGATGSVDTTDSSKDTSASERIVIVGAGIAGLHCAYRLKQKGIAATVYEATGRVGGRMFTERSIFPDGMSCELGGEFIDTTHETLLDLAEELGIELVDFATDDKSLTPLVAWFDGKLLTENDILTGFAPIAEKIDEALATLTDQDDLYVYYDKHNGGAALDAMSLSGWLDSIGASGSVRKLLETAYVIEYGLDATETNCLNMLFLISTDTNEFKEFGESDERFRAKEGNDIFTTKLAEKIGKDSIELNSQLLSIKENANKTYTLVFSTDAGTNEVIADRVVLAFPFSVLRNLEVDVPLPEVKLNAIANAGVGQNSKVMMGFSERIWRQAGAVGLYYTDLGFQSAWDTSRLQPGTSGILTHYSGGTPAVDVGKVQASDNAAGFVEQLDVILPGAKAAYTGKVVRFVWPTYPYSLCSYAAYRVGQYTTICGSEAERVGNLHFCGEHTNLDAQGYMEGGALSGQVVASEIITDILGDAASAQGALSHAEQRIVERGRLVRLHRRWRAGLRRNTISAFLK